MSDALKALIIAEHYLAVARDSSEKGCPTAAEIIKLRTKLGKLIDEIREGKRKV